MPDKPGGAADDRNAAHDGRLNANFEQDRGDGASSVGSEVFRVAFPQLTRQFSIAQFDAVARTHGG